MGVFWIQNPDSDHLSHVDCVLDSNPDSGPGARVNVPYIIMLNITLFRNWNSSCIGKVHLHVHYALYVFFSLAQQW